MTQARSIRDRSGIFAAHVVKRHLSAGMAKLIGHEPAAAGGQRYKYREKKQQTFLRMKSIQRKAEPKGIGGVPDNDVGAPGAQSRLRLDVSSPLDISEMHVTGHSELCFHHL